MIIVQCVIHKLKVVYRRRRPVAFFVQAAEGPARPPSQLISFPRKLKWISCGKNNFFFATKVDVTSYYGATDRDTGSRGADGARPSQFYLVFILPLACPLRAQKALQAENRIMLACDDEYLRCSVFNVLDN